CRRHHEVVARSPVQPWMCPADCAVLREGSRIGVASRDVANDTHAGRRFMLAQIISGAVLGVDAYLVRVEVDLGRGLPIISVVGLPESAVREGRERVLAALHNEGFTVPPRRITINLAPADIPKSGSAYDLPVAVGILSAAGELGSAHPERICIVGELGLDGSVRPVRGVLSIASRCREEGIRTLICPPANAAEACVVDGLEVIAAPQLGAAV